MPRPILPDLKKLMDDPRYWDGNHPDHGDMVRQVSERFEQAQADKAAPNWEPPNDPKLWSAQRADPDSDRVFERYLGRLHAREKEYSDKLGDGAGPTNRGITQRTLNEVNSKHPDWKLPETTKELTKPQTNFLYRENYFYVPRYHELPKLRGMDRQAPNLPELVFDSGVNMGRADASIVMQKTLEKMYGVDLKSDIRDPKTGKFLKRDYDGDIGPATRKVMQRALDDGRGSELYDRYLKQRIDGNERSNNADKKGIRNRLQDFIDMGSGAKR